MILPKFIIVGDSRLLRFAASPRSHSYWDSPYGCRSKILCLRRTILWDKKKRGDSGDTGWLQMECETLQLALEAV